MCEEKWFPRSDAESASSDKPSRLSSRSPREGGTMSQPKTLAACLALTLAVTLTPTAVAGASGAAPASAQPAAAHRTAVGPAAVVSCQAGTTSGTGDAKFHVCVSSDGNVYSWQSPAGWEFINQGNNAEGFGVCGDTGGGWGPMGWDFDQGGASGFGAPTITQPTAGKFPITITRSTGVVKLKQLFAVAPKSAMSHDHGDARRTSRQPRYRTRSSPAGRTSTRSPTRSPTTTPTSPSSGTRRWRRSTRTRTTVCSCGPAR